MTFIEITGQPCAGKSSFIAQEVMSSKEISFYDQTHFIKMLSFFVGIKYLGFQRTKVLLSWSLNENASLSFRINIFRNAVLKFGIFKNLNTLNLESSQRCLVDEGLSHLSFLFLNTDTQQVVDFTADELRTVNVQFLKSPGYGVIKDRLISRGHKRLKFLPVTCFSKRNQEIEDILLDIYPCLCKELKSS
jgi:hypothetical protein